MAQQHKRKLLSHHFRWLLIAATAAVIIVIPIYMIDTYDYPRFGIVFWAITTKNTIKVARKKSRSHLMTQLGIQYSDSQVVPLGRT